MEKSVYFVIAIVEQKKTVHEIIQVGQHFVHLIFTLMSSFVSVFCSDENMKHLHGENSMRNINGKLG